MNKTPRLLALAGGLLAISAVAAAAETLFEVEHARGIARSGRPISENDAELLDRWGATSGSYGWQDRQGETVEIYIDDYGHRHHRRHFRTYDDRD